MKFSKYRPGIFLLLFTGCSLVACNENSSSEEVTEEYPTTSFSKIQLTETIKSDAQTVTAIQTYTYEAGRLSGYISLQKYVAVEPTEMKSLTTITYGEHQAIITDDFGNVSVYILNDKGYAVSCTRKESGGSTRTYTFSYLINSEGKHFLENITEALENSHAYSSIDIDYNTCIAVRITQKVDTYEQSYIVTPHTGSEIKNISEIPCLFLAELYPVSLHSAALYGKLLGEPFEDLVTQIIPDGNTGSDETIDYTYTTNELGIVTSCKEAINNDGTNYVRTVNYLIE